MKYKKKYILIHSLLFCEKSIRNSQEKQKTFDILNYHFISNDIIIISSLSFPQPKENENEMEKKRLQKIFIDP